MVHILDGVERGRSTFSTKLGPIGREGCDLDYPDDRFISGHHCTIQFDGPSMILTDAGSRNGTHIKIKAALKHGDHVFIGKQFLRAILVSMRREDGRHTLIRCPNCNAENQAHLSSAWSVVTNWCLLIHLTRRKLSLPKKTWPENAVTAPSPREAMSAAAQSKEGDGHPLEESEVARAAANMKTNSRK